MSESCVDINFETDISSLAQRLIDRIASYRAVAIAFSGGVDSAVVAAAAHRALGANAIAITGIGAAVPDSDKQSARAVAAAIGIRHLELTTNEIENADYIRNDGNRCFYCKSTLYARIDEWSKQNDAPVILSGTNADDLGDYRPGLKAAENFGVVAPLADLGITKAQVRELARLWQLEIADKPASPCLASRIAYGQSVTPERLKSIEIVEIELKRLGFGDVRVRVHDAGLVRLEIPADLIAVACAEPTRSRIVDVCVSAGFRYVTLDLQGRQSGSMNRALPVLNG